jgi:phosphoribosylanthranilate isomerase
VKNITSLEPIRDYRVSACLLDTWTPAAHGGTGRAFNWEFAACAAQTGRIILAGGLNPDNVADAIRQVRPYGVDVSSGVESAPGHKDAARIREFIRKAKEAAP